jgi:isoaspartyl peptidase/L-asparaginase-like protein (Ntn-hydrolase superfamily)
MAAAAKRVPALCATWNFGALAVKAGASVLENSGTALDAVEKCVNTIELDTSAQYYVGYGGLPNAAGAMELDAAIMIGDRSQYGAVMAIQGVRTPISVARCVQEAAAVSLPLEERDALLCYGNMPSRAANPCLLAGARRKVLELSPHNILVGDGAKVFALANGFSEMEVLTADSEKAYREWLQERGKEEAVQVCRAQEQAICKGEKADSVSSFQGGVHSSQISGTQFAPQTGGASWRSRGPGDHDTVGVIGLDEQGNIVAGVSTSGWAFCHPGRYVVPCVSVMP